MRDLTVPLIELPVSFKPHRQTTYRYVPRQGKEIILFEAEGPGCVRHFWLTNDTKGVGLRIRIHVDDTPEPQVDMELNHFFGILLDKEPYRIESPGIKVLPLNAYNCYLPIPFNESCRISLQAGNMTGKLNKRYLADQHQLRFVDTEPEIAQLFFQANWQEYASGEGLTPYRLFAQFHEERPARNKGTYNVADIAGRGFVAGMFKAIARKDDSDLLYHTGGSTWLLDGETGPVAYRGFNEEDDFGFSWGFYPGQSQWSGCPHVDIPGANANEFVAWRFFGPDPVPFDSSIVIDFGSRADDTQSVLYYYKIPDSRAPEVLTPKEWAIVGAFDATSREAFEHHEEVEEISAWPDSMDDLVRLNLPSRHGWVDPRPGFLRFYPLWRSFAEKVTKKDPTLRADAGYPLGVALYGRGVVRVETAGDYNLHIGFDDWLKLWVNGEPVGETLRHERGFAVATVPVLLRAGENTIMIKLSNATNREYRLWAFSVRVV